MGSKPTDHVEVVLIRPGVERQEFVLPPGSTLADLIREAVFDANPQQVLIDGRPLEECLTLQTGMTISLVPRPEEATSREAWRETIGFFQGNAAFRDLVESVEASRQAKKDRSS